MTLVIIPARMNSTRLPGKPMAMINGLTLIERCFHQAIKASFQPWVATDSDDIANLIGSSAVMTGECASGTDRVAAAAEIIDPEGKHEFVINYQGDMPFLEPERLKHFVEMTERGYGDVTTAFTDLQFVGMRDERFRRQTAHCHIGLYGYKREALRLFASLPQSAPELGSRLEQLRAPDKFKWFYVAFLDMPIEVNTQADLDRARSCLM